MLLKNCICLVTTPGSWINKFDDVLLTQFKDFLAQYHITGKYVDSIPGWGCQSQDWYQFTADIEPNYGWVSIMGIPEEKWKPWLLHFTEGQLLMQISLIKGNTLVPYQ